VSFARHAPHSLLVTLLSREVKRLSTIESVAASMFGVGISRFGNLQDTWR